MWIIWIIVAAVIGTVIYEIYKSKKQNNEYEKTTFSHLDTQARYIDMTSSCILN